MSSMHIARLILVPLIVVWALGTPIGALGTVPDACESGIASGDYDRLHVAVKESTLELQPSSVAAGVVCVTVENAGRGNIDLILVQIPPGLSVQEARFDITSFGEDIEWTKDAFYPGFPAVPTPGETSLAFVDLFTGTYLLFSPTRRELATELQVTERMDQSEEHSEQSEDPAALPDLEEPDPPSGDEPADGEDGSTGNDGPPEDLLPPDGGDGPPDGGDGPPDGGDGPPDGSDGPEETATIQITKYFCPDGYDASGEFDILYSDCVETGESINFEVSGAGVQTIDGGHGSAEWTGLTAGQAYTVSEDLPDAYADPRVSVTRRLEMAKVPSRITADLVA